MNTMAKKMFVGVSALAAVVLLSGCSGCPTKKHHNKKMVHYAQPQAVEVVETDAVVFYQVPENMHTDNLYAKMYTHSSHGGESKMGYIKFHQTDNGLKMKVDLKDMRPGVQYHVKLYQCGSCHNDAKCCTNAKKLSMDMPMLQTGKSGRLEQTYMLQGVTASQLQGANIYLERDGGYKAGWGKLEK